MIGTARQSRYSRGAIILHWVMGLLIIGNLAGGFLHDYVPREGGQRMMVMDLHRGFGLIILALALVRIGWRLGHRPPPLPSYFTTGERLMARITHIGFYVLMLALPLTGWAMADRNGRALTAFGTFEVTKLGVGEPLGNVAHEAHEVIGWLMLAALALHVAALVKHRILDRDNLLPRMGIGTPRGL